MNMNRRPIAKMKRRACALLSICMLCAGVPAASMAEQTQHATLTMMGLDEDSSGRMWETNQFFVRMAEKTGVSFTFEQFSAAEDYEKAMEKLSERKEDELL